MNAELVWPIIDVRRITEPVFIDDDGRVFVSVLFNNGQRVQGHQIGVLDGTTRAEFIAAKNPERIEVTRFRRSR